MDTIYHDDLTGKCILITMAYEYFDVIEKLKAMGIYDNTDIYLFSLMKMLEAEDKNHVSYSNKNEACSK